MNNIKELKDYEYFRSPTGKGVLYKGDCLEIMPLLEEKSIDMICCDLPYQMVSCDWDILIPFEPLWQNYKRVRKDNTAIALFGSQPFTSELVMSNKKEFKYEWIWEKNMSTNGANANKQPLKKHELVSVFYKKQCMYNPQYTKGNPYKINRKKPSEKSYLGKTGLKKEFLKISDGLRYPTSILKFKKDSNKLHPTQKPVALIEYLIKTYTNENMLVLDNTAGSCTTAIACENLNRNYICIEQSEEYCEIGKKRIIEATKQLKLF